MNFISKELYKNFETQSQYLTIAEMHLSENIKRLLFLLSGFIALFLTLISMVFESLFLTFGFGVIGLTLIILDEIGRNVFFQFLKDKKYIKEEFK